MAAAAAAIVSNNSKQKQRKQRQRKLAQKQWARPDRTRRRSTRGDDVFQARLGSSLRLTEGRQLSRRQRQTAAEQLAHTRPTVVLREGGQLVVGARLVVGELLARW